MTGAAKNFEIALAFRTEMSVIQMVDIECGGAETTMAPLAEAA